MNPTVLAIAAGCALAYYGGVAVVHTAKKVGHSIIHIIKKI